MADKPEAYIKLVVDPETKLFPRVFKLVPADSVTPSYMAPDICDVPDLQDYNKLTSSTIAPSTAISLGGLERTVPSYIEDLYIKGMMINNVGTSKMRLTKGKRSIL